MSASASLREITRSMVAPGASAWDHWVSSAISPAQLTSSLFVGSKVGHVPVMQMMFRWAGGKSNVESKLARSLAISGFPNASMMTMVLPAPVRLLGLLAPGRFWAGCLQPGFAGAFGHENTPAWFGPLVC